MPGRAPCQTLLELLETMHTLRAPGGCPWDAGQTPATLAPYILEEACEAIEAIESGSPAQIADELGDLLLQVVFQAEIHAERGDFDFADVAALINEKLRRRHPHVFAGDGGEIPDTPGLVAQWESIKHRERAERQPDGDGRFPGAPPAHLPALQRAQKLVARAGRHGINLAPATAHPSPQERIGTELFRMVCEAEAQGVDAEQALRFTIRRLLVENRDHPPLFPSPRN